MDSLDRADRGKKQIVKRLHPVVSMQKDESATLFATAPGLLGRIGFISLLPDVAGVGSQQFLTGMAANGCPGTRELYVCSACGCKSKLLEPPPSR